MQRISFYTERDAALVGAALRQFQSADRGLRAEGCFVGERWFVRFTWPDWPVQQAELIALEVEKFRHEHPEFHDVTPGSPDWVSVSRGWEADSESAEAIADRLNRHFNGKVGWVESERDNRGRIAAECKILHLGGALRPELVGPALLVAGPPRSSDVVTLQLFWKDCMAVPPSGLTQDDQRAFQQAIKEIFDWAARRIQPILDALRDKLTEHYGNRFRNLYVFGSYARPDAGIELPIDSDLDVAVLLSDIEDRYREIEAMSEIAYNLSIEHGLSVSLTPLREDEFREGSTSFAKGISAYAKPA